MLKKFFTVVFVLAGISVSVMAEGYEVSYSVSQADKGVEGKGSYQIALIKKTSSGNMSLAMMVMLWCTDVGAYRLGSSLGQLYGHRLFPSISPKKSWEGFFGGLVCSVAGAVLLRYFGLLELSLFDAIAVGIIICIFGVLGDLVESQLKRKFGVKDSGSIMPGHGGMLDRFDGALLAFPVAIIYIIFFAA